MSSFVQNLVEYINARKMVAARIGEVTDVDTATMTCTVAVEGEDDYEEVRLTTDEYDAGTVGMLPVPQVGSAVTMIILEGMDGQAMIVQADKVSELVIRGGSLGGLVKIDALVDRLTAIEGSVKDILQAIQSAPVAPSDGGAAFKSGLVSALSASDPGTTLKSDLENQQVTHG